MSETRTYKAYNGQGRLLLHVSANSSATIAAEEAAFQSRLNRCELFYVDVTSSTPEVKGFRMWPQQTSRS